MTVFKTLKEAIDSIGYGLCSLCKAEHEFPDVKCDLMDGKEGECDKCANSYELSSRDNRCGDCGNCGTCCTHEREGK